MTHKFYFNVPGVFTYDWSIGKSSEAILQKMTGVPEVIFIRNSLSEISTGDCYQATVDSEYDETMFFLRSSEFEKIQDSAVDKYMNEEGLEERRRRKLKYGY